MCGLEAQRVTYVGFLNCQQKGGSLCWPRKVELEKCKCWAIKGNAVYFIIW